MLNLISNRYLSLVIKRKVKKTNVAEEIKDSSSTSTDAVRPSALTRRKLNQKNCNIIVFI